MLDILFHLQISIVKSLTKCNAFLSYKMMRLIIQISQKHIWAKTFSAKIPMPKRKLRWATCRNLQSFNLLFLYIVVTTLPHQLTQNFLRFHLGLPNNPSMFPYIWFSKFGWRESIQLPIWKTQLKSKQTFWKTNLSNYRKSSNMM